MLNKDKYTELIARYFAGEASTEEIQELSLWVMDHPANKSLFVEYRKTWQAVEDHKLEGSINIDNEWAMMESLLPAEEDDKVISISPVMHSVRWATRIAAILLIAIVPLYFLYQYLDTSDMVAVVSTDELIECTLPDGSIVNLNHNSSIEYPEQFNDDNREVIFTGEAFFNVAHDNSKPFIISTNGVRVKVLGTTFNVNTRKPNGETEVVLVDGSVKVYYKGNEPSAVKLVPGEKALVHKQEKAITVVRNKNPNFMAWKTKLIIFLDEPLDQVVKTLNHVYGSRIQLAGKDLSNCRITATFENQSLDAVLEVISSTLGLQIQSSPFEIVLSGSPCN
ncbi:MAG: FecR domain-containing protein [Bacteroidota bacterium]|nr:FecR domain-containing protein [Bacteroidota bacterium]